MDLHLVSCMQQVLLVWPREVFQGHGKPVGAVIEPALSPMYPPASIAGTVAPIPVGVPEAF